MTGSHARRQREVSLRLLISRQCNCSRRSVYLLDEVFYYPSDEDIDAFIESVRPTQFHWTNEIHDCDDIAREFWTKSKTWFKETKSQNAAIGFLCRTGISTQKPHAFNFYVRKRDHTLIFVDRYERVPISGTAYLVLM